MQRRPGAFPARPEPDNREAAGALRCGGPKCPRSPRSSGASAQESLVLWSVPWPPSLMHPSAQGWELDSAPLLLEAVSPLGLLQAPPRVHVSPVTSQSRDTWCGFQNETESDASAVHSGPLTFVFAILGFLPFQNFLVPYSKVFLYV